MKKKMKMKKMMKKKRRNLILTQVKNLREKGGLRKKTMKKTKKTKKIPTIIALTNHPEKHQKILL